MLSLRQQQIIRSSKCLWGLCIHVGHWLTSRLTVVARGIFADDLATNLEIVYDRGRLIGPPGKYERWSSIASSGPVGLGYDNRPGTGSSLESWRSIHEEGRMSSFSKSSSLPLCIVEN
ncbi:hypothetical protein PIB30_075202 [Stylosanthes scabra]|uniref:Uncharacterized protein n=1 Tax=Stylosanthes scabra TaxID=79078 RepID=A0ABU6QQ03_9FABA|nr:hypothetical protein [Stylosanthes scabra]